MKMSKQGRLELANYEALAHTKYLDSGGVETIGIGMTVSEIHDIHVWPWDKKLYTKQCVDYFNVAIEKYENAVNATLKVDLLPHQFDALVSITYNIGIAGMKGSSFMKRVNAKDKPEAVVEAMSWWNKDNGKIVKGLKNRRAAEGQLYLSGNYKSDKSVGLIIVDSKTHKPKYEGRINIWEYL